MGARTARRALTAVSWEVAESPHPIGDVTFP